jgi:hypothetical protein
MAKEKEVKPKSKSKTVKPIKKSKDIKISDFIIDGHFIHIKVGNEMRPASDSDIKETEEKISDIIEENKIKCIVFVTHHAVEINVY